MILSNYSIKFRVTVFVLVFIILAAGPLTYIFMPREGFPDVTIPYIFVTAPYQGVAPAEIENLVTIPMEKRFKDLENIKEITSSSAEGVSAIVIQFTPKENIDNAVQKVKAKIDLARPDLPQDLDEPIVQGLNSSTDIPIIDFAVSGDGNLERLNHIAEDIRDGLETIPGVLQARIAGARERELQVLVDLQRLNGYSLTLYEVIGAIQSENTTVSAGNLEVHGNKFQVRVPGEFKEVGELRNIPLRIIDGRPVRLSDVAEIKDGFKDVESMARVNGKPCVSLSVHKRSGENTVKLIKRIKDYLAATPLPPGIATTIVNDQSEFIRLMVEDLENSVASGFLMVLAILFLFMGFRNALLVALAIPLSCMIGFLVLDVSGMTLNMMVLFSLVLTVGMVVDDAVVVVENIFRHHSEGQKRLDAARDGASEVAWPVITSTLTTLAAFVPLIFWPDIMGQFMSFLPKTVIIVLTASLFVAMVINPAMCSMMITKRKGEGTEEKPGPWRRFMGAYERILRAALARRGLVMALGAAFLVFSMMLFARYSAGKELFPDNEPRRATISVRYPEGTDIRTTDATLQQIEQGLGKYKDVKFWLTGVGASGGGHLMSASEGTHLGSINVEFKALSDREGNSRDLVNRIRSDIGSFPGAEITVEKEREGPPTGAPVSIEIAGEDFEVLKDVADQIMMQFKTNSIVGLVDVQKNMEDAKPELRFRVDRERAALMGLNTGSIGFFLRTAVNGEQVSKFRAGEDEYDITVRLREDQRQSTDLLKDVYIPTASENRVPLASLGSYTYDPGRGQIQRKDQKRIVMITGNDGAGRGVDKILMDVRERVSHVPLPKGYSINYTGDNKEMNDAFIFLVKALLAALAMIAIILVMEFNSVVLPFIILFSVLLSMIGVLWSLLLFNMKFCVIMTGIGILCLAGVVVKNGIVMIDYINKRKEAGMSPFEAIVAGARIRLRPVLMTAITAVVGLVPMAMGWTLEIHRWPPRIVGGAEMSSFWAPMAIAVIFGLSLATVLTLIQVPVMVSLADSFRNWLGRLFGRFGGEE
jgi:CzcA family heavy metal efflux pump